MIWGVDKLPGITPRLISVPGSAARGEAVFFLRRSAASGGLGSVSGEDLSDGHGDIALVGERGKGKFDGGAMGGKKLLSH